MEFSVMVWRSEAALNNSIFAVIEKGANSSNLPRLSDRGGWHTHRMVFTNRFKFAAEAKKSIAERGYYLIGGELNIAEIEDRRAVRDNGLPPGHREATEEDFK